MHINEGIELEARELELIRENPTHNEDFRRPYRYYQSVKTEILNTRSTTKVIIVQDDSKLSGGSLS